MRASSVAFIIAGRSALLSLGLCLSVAAVADEILIDVQSDPPLPLKNLLQNGGFENGLEGWKVMDSKDQGWQVKLSDEAFQGSHSLYVQVSNDARHHARGATQSLSRLLANGVMAKDRSYFISCWIKGKGVSNIGGDECGAGATLAFHDAGWRRNAKTDARGRTETGWRKLVGGPLKCEDWMKAGEAVAGVAYSCGDGEAWIDEVCVSEAVLSLNLKVKGGPFRQVLVEGDNDAVLFDSGRLQEGTTEYRRSFDVSCQRRIAVSVVGRDGGISRKIVDGSPVRQNPLMEVDGKPFFPIGTEVIGARPEERDEREFRRICAELKDAGFNLVLDYSATQKSYPVEPAIAMRNLKIAGENGLKMLVSFHDAVGKRKDGTGKELVERIVPACKDDAALLGWWIVDEPNAKSIPMAAELYRLAKSLDGNHPVYTNFSPFAYEPKGDEEIADLISGDGYPIHKQYGELHDKYITAAADCLLKISRPFAGRKPVFFWVQGFGESKTESHACPTYEQIRFITYDAIAHGASGILFWTIAMDGRPPWADVKRVAGELRRLYPALISPDTGNAVWVKEGGSRVSTWFRVCGKKAYLIAVNRSEDICQATLLLPVRFTKALRLFEPESTLMTRDYMTLQDSFGRYGCHVYELDI